MNHKKELLRSLWVKFRTRGLGMVFPASQITPPVNADDTWKHRFIGLHRYATVSNPAEL